MLASGSVGLAGQTMNWSVSPSGAATLGSTSNTTGINGQATQHGAAGFYRQRNGDGDGQAAGTTLAPATFTITAIPLSPLPG